MADKQAALSIVLRTVDRATAGINAFNKRLDAITKPARDLGKALKDLGEKSGFNQVVDGFKGVGGAVQDLLGKVALVGGVVALAVHGVFSLVDKFDKLGDTAERLGTSADFLAAFRFAAERAGAPIEGVDEALQTLVTNMGAAKAGTGKMLKFLSVISPTLAKQVTAAHSLEEALGLLADASAKLPDAARRSKLAMATLGNAALAPLLARGSKGVQELLTRFAALAPAQGEAAEAAGKVDDALKDLHAATDGVEAALITGLAPALTVIVEKLKNWLVDHRDDVKRWAIDIGEKLPGAVDKVIAVVRDAVGGVTKFIDSVGGLKTAAILLTAFLVGPLVSSFATLSIAMLSTPFGALLVSLGAVLAMAISINDEIGKFASSLDTSHEVLLQDAAEMTHEQFIAAHPEAKNFHLDTSAGRIGTPDANGPMSMLKAANGAPWGMAPRRRFDSDVIGAATGAGAAAGRSAEASLKVEFVNAPRGTRVTGDPRNTADVDWTVGYQLFGAL